MTNMTGSKLSIFSHPGKITGYWITTRSFPYRGSYCPGQYGPRLRLRPIWKCPCINLYLIRHATLLVFIYCYKIYHESALKKQNHQPHVFIIFERWNIRGTISQKINHFLQIWETNLLKLYKNKR